MIITAGRRPLGQTQLSLHSVDATVATRLPSPSVPFVLTAVAALGIVQVLIAVNALARTTRRRRAAGCAWEGEGTLSVSAGAADARSRRPRAAVHAGWGAATQHPRGARSATKGATRAAHLCVDNVADVAANDTLSVPLAHEMVDSPTFTNCRVQPRPLRFGTHACARARGGA